MTTEYKEGHHVSQVAHLQSDHPVTVRTDICGIATIHSYGILGRHSGDYNWKLDRTKPNGFDHITNMVPEHIMRLWMPIPTDQNAKILKREHFRNETISRGVTIKGGARCDGVFVPKGDMFAITSADCPTVVVVDRGRQHVLCLHAGADSLFDRAFFETGRSSRLHFSIIDAAIDAFRKMHIYPPELCFYIFCGIRRGFRYDPNHRIYGPYNRRVLDWCDHYYQNAVIYDLYDDELDLYKVIRSQAIEHGVPKNQIHFDGVDTYRDTDQKGRHLWASARRKTKEVQRNLVLVLHRE